MATASEQRQYPGTSVVDLGFPRTPPGKDAGPCPKVGKGAQLKQVSHRDRVVGHTEIGVGNEFSTAKASITHHKREQIEPLEPTLTVFVTNQADLEKLEIPAIAKIEVLQLQDLRKRYEAASKSEAEHVKKGAARLLEKLEQDAKHDGNAEAAKQYKARIAAIQLLVKKHKSK